MNTDEYTLHEHTVSTADGHTLYVQDWGHAAATTLILFLHGGPGGRSTDGLKRSFDPTRHRVIFADQRGCGRSLPYGSLHNNTIDTLADDITLIADQLNIDRFVLAGGSWGTCLALYYAINNPQRVTALVLGGVFTGSQHDIDWITKGGFKTQFPELWADYCATVPESRRHDPSAYHFERILGQDPATAKQSAYTFHRLHRSIAATDDRYDTPEPFENFDDTGTRMTAHYFTQGCFMRVDYIYKHAASLTMPVHMVSGRYDLICPPAIAERLRERLPNSTHSFVRAGHSPTPEMISILKRIYAELY